jgi:hypothetical protein
MPTLRSPRRPQNDYESAANSSVLTRPVESLDIFLVEHEFRDRARDICVVHQRSRTIVEDQPLTIDTSCDRSRIFVWEEALQDNDLHIVLGNASLQQRSIFEGRVVLKLPRFRGVGHSRPKQTPIASISRATVELSSPPRPWIGSGAAILSRNGVVHKSRPLSFSIMKLMNRRPRIGNWRPKACSA